MIKRIKEQHVALKEANDHLMERRRFIETVLSRLSAGVLVLDSNSFIVLCNDSASEILHKPELIGRYCSEIFPEIEKLLHGDQVTDLFNKQSHNSIEDNLDDDGYIHLNIQRRDKSINLLIKIAMLRDVYGETTIVTFDDITELVKAQRFEAWADIARRIAHEIKNPLTPIQLAIELLERKFSKQIVHDVDMFEKYIHIIIARVEDIRRMVTNFSNFASISTPVISVHNISKLVHEALVLQQVANPSIDYKFDNSAQDCYVHCDRMQIVQILTNLLKNSAESIAEKIQREESKRVTSQPSTSDSSYKGSIKVEMKISGARVVLSVCDNGHGLDSSIADRISEPYTTTKIGGDGLGLSIVNRITKEHKGKFHIVNLPDGGVKASFDLQLAKIQ